MQTLRYESVELIQQLNTDVNKIRENNIDVNHSATLFGYSSLSQIPNESIHLIDQNNKDFLAEIIRQQALLRIKNSKLIIGREKEENLVRIYLICHF